MGRSCKRTRRRKRLIKLSAFFLIVAIGAILHIQYNVNPVIRTVSEQTVKAMTTEAVNEAASLIMSQTVGYSDIIQTQKNNEGDIVMITADPAVINELARGVTLLAQSRLWQTGEQGITVPIGSLTGITFLSGKGKPVTFKAIPVGSATTRFVSDFQSMGINQTLHRIFMNVYSDVSVVIPGMDITVNTVTEVLVTESVIVGKVPDTYLQSGSLDEMLNLIP